MNQTPDTTPERDDLDWDRARDGRMRDYATDDDAVPTTVYTPEED